MAGAITGHLIGMSKQGKLGKPSLQVNASVSIPHAGMVSPAKYDKEDYARVEKELKAIKHALDNWVPEDVAARAKRSLEIDLKAKKARCEELKARIEGYEDEMSDDEESEDDEY